MISKYIFVLNVVVSICKPLSYLDLTLCLSHTVNDFCPVPRKTNKKKHALDTHTQVRLWLRRNAPVVNNQVDFSCVLWNEGTTKFIQERGNIEIPRDSQIDVALTDFITTAGRYVNPLHQSYKFGHFGKEKYFKSSSHEFFPPSLPLSCCLCHTFSCPHLPVICFVSFTVNLCLLSSNLPTKLHWRCEKEIKNNSVLMTISISLILPLINIQCAMCTKYDTWTVSGL